MSDRAPLLVVRPEPGNARTCSAAAARGLAAEAMPLFAVVPHPWSPPDPARFDAVLLTSANAVRHGGAGLARFAGLSILAVGAATAAAARAAGLDVAVTGTRDAAALAADAAGHGWHRLLHLGGRDHVSLPGVEAVAVYASEALSPPADAAARMAGRVVLLHSARAARAVAALAGDRAPTMIAAISPAVAAAAGPGWRAAAAAAIPDDAALLAVAARLASIDRGDADADKREP